MSTDRLDPDTLAALLDGRLSAEERTRALATIAAGGEAYRDFVEAAALHLDLSDEGFGTQGKAGPALGDSARVASAPQPAKPSQRYRGLVRASALLAAGIVAVFLLRSRSEDGAITLSRRALSSAYASIDRGLLSGQSGPAFSGWGSSRGPDGSLERSARAFRLGVRSADLRLAVILGDSSATRTVARDVAALAAGAMGGAAVAAHFERLGQSPNDATQFEGEGAVEELRSISGATQSFDLGVLLESTRLVARSGKHDVWQPGGAARQLLDRALAIAPRLPPAARTRTEPALAELRRWSDSARTSPDFPAALPRLDSAVAALGR